MNVLFETDELIINHDSSLKTKNTIEVSTGSCSEKPAIGQLGIHSIEFLKINYYEITGNED